MASSEIITQQDRVRVFSPERERGDFGRIEAEWSSPPRGWPAATADARSPRGHSAGWFASSSAGSWSLPHSPPSEQETAGIESYWIDVLPGRTSWSLFMTLSRTLFRFPY